MQLERHLTGTSGKTGTRWNFEPTPSPSLFHRVDRKTDFEAPLAAEIEQISATTRQGALCLCAWDEDKERGGGEEAGGGGGGGRKKVEGEDDAACVYIYIHVHTHTHISGTTRWL